MTDAIVDRKLATLQVIEDICDIPNADAIVLASVKGWNVVIRKGSYKIGDTCVYCEIDSVLPESILQCSGFWNAEKNVGMLHGRLGNRVKTKKIRGAISQGIVLPIHSLPANSIPLEFMADFDVTKNLGITKYEAEEPSSLCGDQKGLFPSWAVKTDSPRLQNNLKYLSLYKDVNFYVTQKIDGTSCTIYLKDGVFGVCSRNFELDESPTVAYWKAVRDMDIENKLRKLGKNIVIQGELYGEGIQGNKEKIKGITFAFFDAYDPDSRRFYNFDEMVATFAELELPMVPVIATNFKLFPTLDEMLKFAEGKSVINPAAEREGLVFRPMFEMETRFIQYRVAFKVISNKFLVECEE